MLDLIFSTDEIYNFLLKTHQQECDVDNDGVNVLAVKIIGVGRIYTFIY